MASSAPGQLSVIVPTYGRRDLLPRIVEPLLEDPGAAELIVVVDGCDDGSYELLLSLALDAPKLKPLRIENRGENGAREAGVEAARCETVLLLDDDVVPAPGLATAHAARQAARRRHVVLGYMPVALPARRRLGDFARFLYSDWYERTCRLYERYPEDILTSFWAGNFSLRRDDCLAVGLRSHRFTSAYNPDRDFGLRLKRAGFTSEFRRDLKGLHLYTRSPEAFLRDARASGQGRWRIHHLHPDLVGSLAPDAFSHDLRLPLRAALAQARQRPRWRKAVERSFWGARAAAGRMRAWRLEDAAALATLRVIQQRGAQCEARDAQETRKR